MIGDGLRDGDIRANLVEARLGDARNGEQVLDASKWAAFFSEVNDCLGRHGTDAWKLLKLRDGRRIQVEWLRRRLLLLACCKQYSRAQES